MLRRLPTPTTSGRFDLAPQVVLKRSVADLNRNLGAEFHDGADDLNRYQAAFFRVGNRVCALIHYDGEPQTTVTIYLERGLSVEDIENDTAEIMRELALSHDSIVWKEDATAR